MGSPSTGTALIELAEASGITTPHAGRRDPVSADTYGTGMLIADAVCRGATRVILAAGGSATTDGGAGAVAALRGVDLSRVEIAVLTDVTTRFTDAAVVFGPQKGADAATVVALTERLRHQGATYPRDPDTVAGGGAAGGFAGGMWAHFDARLVPGADFVLDACGFDAALAGATAVVVGEGRLDAQTTQGKIIAAILAPRGRSPGLRGGRVGHRLRPRSVRRHPRRLRPRRHDRRGPRHRGSQLGIRPPIVRVTCSA